MGTQRRTLKRLAWWPMADPSLYTPATPMLLTFHHLPQLHKIQTINYKGLKHPIHIIHHYINHNLINPNRFINNHTIPHHLNNNSLALELNNNILALKETNFPLSP